MYKEIALNKRKSLLIMIFFAVFASVIAYIAGFYFVDSSFAPFAIIAALAYTVISYFAGAKMATALNGAHEVTKQQEPRLYRVVENLAITEGMPMPKVYVMEDPAMNAFATGRDPEHAIVATTRGLLDNMTDTELEGVMAHELGHVKNYDIRVSLVAFALASVISIISDIALRMLIFGNSDSENDSSKNPVVMLIGIVAIILAPLVAALIKMAISRRREFLADATGALTTRYPEGLASALEKIGKGAHSTISKQNTSTAHLFIANPLKGKSMSSLFSTHPPIDERVKKLRQMNVG